MLSYNPTDKHTHIARLANLNLCDAPKALHPCKERLHADNSLSVPNIDWSRSQRDPSQLLSIVCHHHHRDHHRVGDHETSAIFSSRRQLQSLVYSTSTSQSFRAFCFTVFRLVEYPRKQNWRIRLIVLHLTFRVSGFGPTSEAQRLAASLSCRPCAAPVMLSGMLGHFSACCPNLCLIASVMTIRTGRVSQGPKLAHWL